MFKFCNEVIKDDDYLLPRPLGPCPADRPLAIGTKLRWHKHTNRQTKKQNVRQDTEMEKQTKTDP